MPPRFTTQVPPRYSRRFRSGIRLLVCARGCVCLSCSCTLPSGIHHCGSNFKTILFLPLFSEGAGCPKFAKFIAKFQILFPPLSQTPDWHGWGYEFCLQWQVKNILTLRGLNVDLNALRQSFFLVLLVAKQEVFNLPARFFCTSEAPVSQPRQGCDNVEQLQWEKARLHP